MAHSQVLHRHRAGRANRNQERVAAPVHYHAAFTHFPISFFGAAFLFQVLHFFVFETPFELSTTVCVLIGALSMIPAIASGWFTWKRQYHGARARIIRRKIFVAFGMLAVSLPLAVWRIALYYLGSQAHGIDHYVFFAFTAVLIAGAVVEGYYGGHLAHRRTPVLCDCETPEKRDSP